MNNIEEKLNKQGMKLPAMKITPLSSYYRPELRAIAELDTNDVTKFQELSGEMRWSTGIGRVDILHEVLVLSEFQA